MPGATTRRQAGASMAGTDATCSVTIGTSTRRHGRRGWSIGVATALLIIDLEYNGLLRIHGESSDTPTVQSPITRTSSLKTLTPRPLYRRCSLTSNALTRMASSSTFLQPRESMWW
jgi:hypothetical protein